MQNVIERAVITSRSGHLSFDLPGESVRGRPSRNVRAGSGEDDRIEVVPEEEIRKRIRENTLGALKKSGWKIYGPGGAAQLLGLKPTTLSARIRKMKLKREEGDQSYK